jgi:hypothetical protein
MPLYPGARELIRANLEIIKSGRKATLKVLGRLTDEQLRSINEDRAKSGYPLIQAEVVFFGQHIYKSRVLGDGYTFDDVIDQIESGMSSVSTFTDSHKMTTIMNPNERADGYQNRVRDKIVLECSTRYPRPELFSVIPKGDTNKPNKKATCLSEVALILSDSPG